MAQAPCPKCGGQVEFDVGTRFAECPYCQTRVFIDRSGASFYYILDFLIDPRRGQGIFRRWTAGSKMAKDLEATARIVKFQPQYFPVYMFRRDVGGREEVHVEPARSTTLPGLHRLKVPAGDIKVFDQNYAVGPAELLQPDIEMRIYFDDLPGAPVEQALVYFPIYRVEYEYGGRSYGVVLDASSGEVFASEFPSRGSAAYLAVAGAGFAAFLIEGLSALVNPWLALSAIAVTIVGVFAAGFYVAKRL
jgi:endogenous inhibitor of DNA gyrase (YacG/DUF329 family)